MILSLCDRTGNMVKPWAENGHNCMIVDIQHEPGEHTKGNITRVGVDIRYWIPPKIDYEICFAFPPCTNLSVSGARWFKSKGLRGLIDGLEIVEACRKICEWVGSPWMLENPVSTLSTYWRKPDYSFNPCDYGGYLDPSGDTYTKKTCLWIGNGFKMPVKRPVEPTDGSKIHRLPPSADRGDLRSETPLGFARAVFNQAQGA